MATSAPDPSSLTPQNAVAIVHAFAGHADPGERDEYGRLVYDRAQALRPMLEAEIRASVSRRLGPEFDVEIDLRRGSVELIATILLVGSVVSTYGAVRGGLDYVRQDAERVLRSVLDMPAGAPPHIAAWIQRGPALARFALEVEHASNGGGSLLGGRNAPVLYLAVMATLVMMALVGALLTVVFVKVL